jgi:hypothetical protein
LHQQLRQVLALRPNSFAPPLATHISRSIGCHRGRPTTATTAQLPMASPPRCVSARTVWPCKLAVSSCCCFPPQFHFHHVGAAKTLSCRRAAMTTAMPGIIRLSP